jgi:negative regulator of sigma E activity
MLVVCDGEHTWRIDPGAHAAFSSDAAGCRDTADRLSLFADNHVVEMLGTARVAGRDAYMLAVKTRSGQVRKLLWVDSKTHVVLRSEDYGADGKPRSATRLHSITYLADLPDSLFERPSKVQQGRCLEGAGKSMTRDELSRAIGFRVRLPRWVPDGYRLDGFRLYDCPCGCGHRSARVGYTNGLNVISIFETSGDSGCLTEGKCDMHEGECSVCGQTAVVTRKDISFVVLADVKSAELRRMAGSLK